MSVQSDFINFFELNATFNPTTRCTREVIQRSDRAQSKRQIVTVKEWRREPEPIGYGGTGIIWLEHDEEGKESRVVKQISKATPSTPLESDYRRELQAFGQLSKRQDVFVHFYGWFENDTSIFLAMEYFELGDLEKFITSKLTEKDAKVIGRQLLEGLQILHNNDLAHRDLKPANVFVARCAPNWWVKLGDFGLARRICTEQNANLSRVGTLAYMAPEILLQNDNGEQNSPYTLAVDIWSLGCVLFRLLTQQLPFFKDRHLPLYWQLKKQFPADILLKRDVSEDGVSFISDLMKPNPADRMTAKTALLHSWVSIQESTPTPASLNSFTENTEVELDDKSASAGSTKVTESPYPIPLSVSSAGLGDNRAFLNEAITAHAKGRNISYEYPQLSPYDNTSTGFQNKEVLGLRKSITDGEKLKVDSTTKDSDILEPRPNFDNPQLKIALHKKTIQLFRQTYEARRLFSGAEHPDTLRAMDGLAKSLTKLGQNQEALQIYKQMLDVQKQLFGDEYPDTLRSMSSIASSYSKLGRHQEALELAQQTLDLRKRVLGDFHSDTIWSMQILALFYSNLGRNEEAMYWYEETLNRRKSLFGDNHPDTRLTMNALAEIYSKLGLDQEDKLFS